MPLLHQLLAVRKAKMEIAARVASETNALLGKREAFADYTKVFKSTQAFPDEKGGEPAKLAFEDSKSSRRKMVTTVAERLTYDGKAQADYWDVMLQIATGNMSATGDIVIGEIVLAKKLPVTFLLSLEDWLVSFRAKILAAPCVPNTVPVTKTELDGNRDVWKAETSQTLQTQTDTQYIVPAGAGATDKHPAQIKEVKVEVPIGIVKETTIYGMPTSSDKADMLARVDDLINAVRVAYVRANQAEAPNLVVGEALINYVLNGPVSSK